MPKSVVKPYASMLAKVLLMMSKSVARPPFVENVGLVGVKFAEVNGEAPHQNVR